MYRRGGCTRAAGAVEEFAHVTSTQEQVAPARRFAGERDDRRCGMWCRDHESVRGSTERGGPGSVAPASADPNHAAATYPVDGEAPCGVEPYTGNLKKITATDQNTVVFDLCGPDVAFLQKIAFASFQINDTAWLESHVDPAGTGEQAIVSEPNGTGPYRLANWARGSEIVMEAFPEYWGEAAKAQSLVIRWSTEGNQRVTELQSGTVDGIDNVPPESFATIQGRSQFQLMPREGLNVFYVGFNNNPKNEGFDNSTNPFANEKVRQAVAMGINRDQIVSEFYPPGSEVATHFTPCSIGNGCTGDPWYPSSTPPPRRCWPRPATRTASRPS